jgi:hypothetical protein
MKELLSIPEFAGSIPFTILVKSAEVSSLRLRRTIVVVPLSGSG